MNLRIYSEIMTVLKYIWGKAKRINRNGEKIFIYHPLVCHLIDVAAIAEIFWHQIFSQTLKAKLKHLFAQKEDMVKRMLAFLAGIHDLGKATPIFQSRVPELADNLTKFDLEPYSEKIFHSILSGQLIFQLFNTYFHHFKIQNDLLIHDLKYIIAGHHGRFPKTRQFKELIPEYLGDEKWKDIQEKILYSLLEFCGLDQNNNNNKTDNLRQPLKREEQIALLIFIAGFISVADWIGSNEEFFDYFVDFTDQNELRHNYFSLSRSRAKNALKKIGWDNWKSLKNTSVLTFKKVFPAISELRPLQQQIVDNIDKISAPSLVIIEAPMGEGKTEAALYLEYYLEQTKDLQGAYIALPTQATANQMFQRVQKFLSNIKQGLRVNLHLLHGNAIMSDDYAILKTRSKNFDNEEESNIIADEWFTYRKRGLISPFGVGTIDQILLSVLPLKHFFVRLFGLAGKTVIIDEVHSYDIYMSTILEDLLRWLHYLGSTVILLSATLPSYKRNKLISTYYSNKEEIEEKAYPRLIICSKNGVKISTFDTALKKTGEESVIIEWIEENSIASRLKSCLKDGGRAAIICNKIDRAQTFYRQLAHLEDAGFKVDLLHSRFPFNRRKEIEDDILTKYGKEKDHEQGIQLLISTQIIEQSLDLDFDLMISDLAPVDLLFQRMGRLHRHVRDDKGEIINRPNQLRRAQFWIVKPELNQYNIPQFNHPIYSRYILLKTFLNTFSIKSISIPDDLEPMIEKVYSEKLVIPEVFQKEKEEWIKAINEAGRDEKGKDEKKTLSARYKLIPDPNNEDFFDDFSSYLNENTPKADLYLNSLTRITSPSINLVCLYENDGELFLDETGNFSIYLNREPSHDEAKIILNHGIRVSHYSIFKYFTKYANSIPFSWKKNSLIRNFHHVVLSKEGKTGEYFFDITNYRIYLSNKLGLLIKRQKDD